MTRQMHQARRICGFIQSIKLFFGDRCCELSVIHAHTLAQLRDPGNHPHFKSRRSF